MRRAGLLETEEPWHQGDAPAVGKRPHRCTELGEEVVRALRQKGWLPWKR